GTRLPWQGPVAIEPAADATRAGIVARCSEPEISELVSKLLQEARRRLDSDQWIERVRQTSRPSGRRHELRDALRAGVALRIGIEMTLLPDQPCEEINRDIALQRRSGQPKTDRFGKGRGSGGGVRAWRLGVAGSWRSATGGGRQCGRISLCRGTTSRPGF